VLRAREYEPGDADVWDAFVATAKNATFLFRRGYMDYHSRRFADASLLVCDGDTVRALLPASVRDGVLSSHGGLTYGGFLIDRRMTTSAMGNVFVAAATALAEAGHERLIYKTMPHIYHTLPAEEDIYWLFRCGARLVRRDVLTVIDYACRPRLQERRRRAVRRAVQQGIEVAESNDFDGFWPVLTSNLRERYGVDPVHSIDEIRLLAARFPKEIRLVAAFDEGRMIAGAVLYRSPRVCHVQYIGSSERGRTSGALDAVLATAVDKHEREVACFDFGTSTLEDGRFLNVGLADFKEGFGGRAVVHDHYEVELRVAAGSV
jgi:hypothetical protein